MIIAKPKTNTVLSFTFFLILTAVVVAMNIVAILKSPAWYNYVVLTLLVPIGIFVFYKIFIRYKVIKLGNNQLEITFPVLRRRKKYSLYQIEYWVEKQVKTGKSSVYKELEMKLNDGFQINIGYKEFTEYRKVITYLIQKIPKKQHFDK